MSVRAFKQKVQAFPFDKLAPVGIVLIGGMSLIGMLISTRLGPGVGGDATIYITSARNLLAGKGLGLISASGTFRLIPYFPPFFSLVLAAAGALGLDMVSFANGFNIALLVGLVWLVGFETLRASRSWIYALLAAAVVGASPILIPVYSWAMSEPLSILLGFGSLALLLAYVRNPDRRSLILVVSALACGFGILTRYANAAFLGAAVLVLILLGPSKWRSKIIDAVLYGVIGLLPVAIWGVYDFSMTATVSSRSMATDNAARIAALFPSLADAIVIWLMPESWTDVPRFSARIFQMVVIAAALALLVWLVIVAVQSMRTADRPKNRSFFQSLQTLSNGIWGWVIVLVVFIVVYMVVIAGVYITTYPPITIANRMLSPMHAAVVWLVVLLAAASVQVWKRAGWLKVALPCLLFLLAAFYGLRSLRIVQMYSILGLGYNSVEWQESQTIRAIRNMPADQTIVTNEETAVLYLTGRAAYPLVEIYSAQPYEQFTRYGQGNPTNDRAQQLFKDGQAKLVLFDTIYNQFSSLYGSRSEERTKVLVDGLIQDFHGSDGNIYQCPQP
jgi:hypothetical protein